MKLMSTVALLALTALAAAPVHAQPPRKIRMVLDVQGENETVAGRLMADVRRELQTVPDVELVPPGDSARVIRVITSSGAGFVAASLLVTERYDRETLMVLGIEDDDTANRMMALQIVNDHQMFTGSDVSEVARRLVASLNTGMFARLRR
jgi:hypothetical protein